MSDSSSILTKYPPDPNRNLEFYETEPLAIPPMDPDFDLAFNLDENYEFDIDLDDLDLPSLTDDLLIPNPPQNDNHPDCRFDDVIATFLNSDSNTNSNSNSNWNCDSSSDQAGAGVDFRRSSPVSSCGSGNNGGSGVSDALNVPSLDNEPSGFDNFVVDQEVVKVEEGTNLKRKKNEKENGANGVVRNQKCRVGAVGDDGSNRKLSEEEEKRKERLIRNRESAQLSRQRKKHHVEELEDKVKMMESTIADLRGRISYFMVENASLRQQLGGGVVPPPPPMCSPVAPYTWLPYAPFVVQPPGSQVPLVPIPKLKTQQPVSAPRGNNRKVESGKSKTKKVASVSFLGLLFFLLLFGGLVPVLDVKFGGFVNEDWVGGSSSLGERFYDQHKGRVLIVDGHSNNSHAGDNVEFRNGRYDIEKNRGGSKSFASSNSSEPLFASLYVPRNDKLVKIDGNLIIHSVLASERALASLENPEVNNSKETGLAIPGDLKGAASAILEFRSGKGRHPHLYQTPNEQQKALSSGSADMLKDHVKSSATNGLLQQWFQEGLAGPLLSSGMCTEVFQFDVSPSPGAIVPASPLANVTSEHRQNATREAKGRNRRTLRGLPIPIPGSKINITRKHVAPPQKDNLDGNKTSSSMVVSVLVDPREAINSDVDGVIRPKSFPRIFVVVLLDSVKYVTYSCVLPLAGPHLVTT